MAGEGPVGGHLRNIGDISKKAKNHWDTQVVEPGAEKRTPSQNATNSSKQYETSKGVAGSGKGGMNTNAG